MGFLLEFVKSLQVTDDTAPPHRVVDEISVHRHTLRWNVLAPHDDHRARERAVDERRQVIVT
ncbi:hypothetical protein RYH80_08540 [Halobaculum sp. MBLA0147]|uniref:hypothetical protein n=1 Tax=Halobaculum sp. MBLA0147 TaxID=3079934 RepID=UPI0035240B6B